MRKTLTFRNCPSSGRAIVLAPGDVRICLQISAYRESRALTTTVRRVDAILSFHLVASIHYCRLAAYTLISRVFVSSRMRYPVWGRNGRSTIDKPAVRDDCRSRNIDY